MSRRIVLALDLVDDPALIAEYESWHRPGGPPSDILSSIRDAGVINMEIYRAGTRMTMVIDAEDGFTLEAKARTDAADPAVVAWEGRMRSFQRPIPAAGSDGGWFAMTRLFSLAEQPATGGGKGE